MKTYIINLPCAKDRLGKTNKHLKEIGFDFEVVEAIDGKNISLPHPDYSQTSYTLMHGKKPNLGEIGCYLSHIKALRKFLITEEEHALIVEDDVRFSKEIPLLINQSLLYKKHWDILRLIGFHSGFPVKIKQLDKRHYLCVNLGNQTGAGAYVINRKAAKNIIKHLLPMKIPYDHAFDRDWLFGVNTLFICPAPSNHVSSDSYIWSLGFEKLNLVKRSPVFFYRLTNELSRLLFRGMQVIKLKFTKL